MGVLLPGSDTIRVYSRAEWGARSSGPLHAQPRAPREAFLHHTAGPSGHRTLAAQKTAMREIQRFHMDSNGWSEIGYHFVVFQPFGNIPVARVFEARPWETIPAAQAHHNTGTLAVCVVGDFTREALKRNTRYALGLLLRSHGSARALKTVGGHGDVFGTECPGGGIRQWIPRIADAADLKVYR